MQKFMLVSFEISARFKLDGKQDAIDWINGNMNMGKQNAIAFLDNEDDPPEWGFSTRLQTKLHKRTFGRVKSIIKYCQDKQANLTDIDKRMLMQIITYDDETESVEEIIKRLDTVSLTDHDKVEEICQADIVEEGPTSPNQAPMMKKSKK